VAEAAAAAAVLSARFHRLYCLLTGKDPANWWLQNVSFLLIDIVY
jgi:hypothetical protein